MPYIYYTTRISEILLFRIKNKKALQQKAKGLECQAPQTGRVSQFLYE